MQFNSLAEIMEMSGYGSYVWSSVFIVVLVLVILMYDSLTLKRRTLGVIKREMDRAEKIMQARKAQRKAKAELNGSES